MKKNTVFTSCLILLLLVLSYHVSPAQNIKKRQLISYENGGECNFNWSFNPEKRRQVQIDLRNFLQTKWNQKKLARVTSTFYTLEGDPLISKFHIEENKKGIWVITEEWERTCCMLYQLEKKKRKPVITRGRTVYTSIEEVINFISKIKTELFPMDKFRQN